MADRIQASTDVGSASRRLSKAGRYLSAEWRGERRRLADDTVPIFQRYAPRKSGRLHRGIRTRIYAGRVVVVAEARDPESGYDYVGVTRFGHRKKRIYPVKAKALRTPWGPRAWVRGYKPKSDWMRDALPEARELAKQRMKVLGRRVAIRLGSG